jgi:hypothetical protein
MNKVLILITVMTVCVTPYSFVSAHPGRTDSSGCHTCRTNCSNWGLSSGEYHCHNAKAVPQPEAPIKSTYGENGTGFTSPAPEYKQQSIKTPSVVNQSKNKIKSSLNESSSLQKKVISTTTQMVSTTITSPVLISPPLDFQKNKGYWFTRLFSWLK